MNLREGVFYYGGVDKYPETYLASLWLELENIFRNAPWDCPTYPTLDYAQGTVYFIQNQANIPLFSFLQR